MGGWVAREIQHEHFWFRPVIQNGRFQLGKNRPHRSIGHAEHLRLQSQIRRDAPDTMGSAPRLNPLGQESLAPDALTLLWNPALRWPDFPDLMPRRNGVRTIG